MAAPGVDAFSPAATGVDTWQLSNPAPLDAFGRALTIEGYASAPSIDLSERISFHVSVAPGNRGTSPDFKIEIFRLGWYQGQGAQRVTHPVRLPGIAQAAIYEDRSHGLTECGWTSQYSLIPSLHPDFPSRWSSGYYVARLTELGQGRQSYVRFVVRNDRKTPAILIQSNVMTDACYNIWGGPSAYVGSGEEPPATEVSLRRPSTYQHGLGVPFKWEYSLIRFVEREGYDVGYTTDVDIHRDPSPLFRADALLTAGHSEYWTREMRDAVQTAVNLGVNVGFLGANNCYWQVRLAPSRWSGDPLSTVVAYKARATSEDPDFRKPSLRGLTTCRWRDVPLDEPENALVGAMYYFDPVHGDIVVDNAEHWIFEGTGLKRGSVLKGLLGYEVDRIFDNGHSPAGLVRLCHSGPTPTFPGDRGRPYSDMTIYQARSGAQVFAAGSMQWVWGLDDFGTGSSLADERARTMMRNLLRRFARS